MSICILADAADIDRAKQIDLEYKSVDDLKKCVSVFISVSPPLPPLVLPALRNTALLTRPRALLQAQQEQEARQEARQELRRLPCLGGAHQADPPSARPRSLQGGQVPHPRLARGGPLEQAERGPLDDQVPAQEGALLGRRRWPRPDDRRPGPRQRHAECVSVPVGFPSDILSSGQ